MSAEEHAEIVKEMHHIALILAKVEQKQIDNHIDNQNDIKLLADRIDKFDNLPCSEHIADIKNMKEHVKEGGLYRRAFIMFALGSFVTVYLAGQAWGTLKNSVDEHHRDYQFVIEHCCSDAE